MLLNKTNNYSSMNQSHTVYILDAGNTILKFAKFENGQLINFRRVNFDDLEEYVINESLNNSEVFGASVLNEEANQLIQRNIPAITFFDKSSKLPISIKYSTPETLGLDRICNSVAGYNLCNKENVLTIDVGTCVKFDITNKNGEYLGGSISPGIDLRFKSMNDYTKNLPLIKNKEKTELIGKSTITSMQSGVINGIQAEINQFILRYSDKFENLFVFLTGGDREYFDIPLKNNTFVDEFLTIKGLYHIYLINEV